MDGKVVATVVSTNDRDGSQTIRVNGHEIQYGAGRGGDGFCYSHQSFDCIQNLTPEEIEAVNNANEANRDI